MGQITRVMYQRVLNLGNYEAERVEAEAVVNEGESANLVLAHLKAFVNSELGLTPTMTDEEAKALTKKLNAYKKQKERGL